MSIPADPEPPPTIRRLAPADVPSLLLLIDALADYERLPRPDASARDQLASDATSDPPRFSALIAHLDGRPVGYAVHFLTYSTFLARPTLFVEDIFVLPEARRSGVGRALMREMARTARASGCGRMEWAVLDWNEPAIRFYRSLGGKHLAEWQSYRLGVEEIEVLAEEEKLDG